MLLRRLLLTLALVFAIGVGVYLFAIYAPKEQAHVSVEPPPQPEAEQPLVPTDTDTRKLPDSPGKDSANIPLPAPTDGTAPGSAGPDVTGLNSPPPVLSAPTTAEAAGTFERQLALPIAKLKAADIHDTFNDARGGGMRRHEATDIMAPRGTPVIAVEDGIVKKLFDSKNGGLTVYQFDPMEKYAYYYAHLDRYAEGLKEGMLLKRGDKVGYVGSSGDAAPDAPHLHFGILKMGPDKKWYGDATSPVNPYPIFMQNFKRR